jgi:uroporphyrinogen-III synthase
LAPGAAARARGLEVAWVGDAGAEDLARRVAASLPGGRVLFLAGRDARREGPQALEAAGLDVEEVVVYRMAPREAFAGEVQAAPRPAALVVGSPRAGEALAGALPSARRAEVLAAPAVVPGATSAEALSALGFRAVTVAGPSDRLLARAVRDALRSPAGP